MASGICTVGFEPTPGFDALAEIQGPEVVNRVCLFSNYE